MSKNLQVLLANRPTGWVEESDFRLVESPMPKPGPASCWPKSTGSRWIPTCADA